MTEFYFVRHGETTVNQAHQFNGGLSNGPLTAVGVAGAQAVGARLAQHHFTQVLSSSMPRAMATTDLIMAANAYAKTTPVQPVNALREMILGDWDGRTVEELNAPEAIATYSHDPLAFDATIADRIHAEHYAAVERRTRTVIDTAFAAHPAGRILVVGHGIVFLLLLNTLLGRPLAEARESRILQNATVTKLITANGRDFTEVYRNR
ncbi:histidine phosphatase family protein [Lacticaseibacillus kribbianus]|uniref:histidine phosphatase family protein n=1 Tax=Lacticaseibacillus kribbianus TaxID=2926292 RepID=UPI001CD46942|nr:histidine phosphatase family protein [Lacticaseibacillus kribbianus]